MVQIIKENTLNLNKYTLYRENGRNLLYYDRKNRLFVKIFIEPMSLEKSKFLQDLLENSSFIKKFCPNLLAMIVEEVDNDLTLVKGYIMQKGRLVPINALKKYFTDKKNQAFWKKYMVKYGFYHNDLKPGNLIYSTNGKISLIDLEALRPWPSSSQVKKFKNSKNIKKKIMILGIDWYYKCLEQIEN